MTAAAWAWATDVNRREAAFVRGDDEGPTSQAAGLSLSDPARLGKGFRGEACLFSLAFKYLRTSLSILFLFLSLSLAKGLLDLNRYFQHGYTFASRIIVLRTTFMRQRGFSKFTVKAKLSLTESC